VLVKFTEISVYPTMEHKTQVTMGINNHYIYVPLAITTADKSMEVE